MMNRQIRVAFIHHIRAKHYLAAVLIKYWFLIAVGVVGAVLMSTWGIEILKNHYSETLANLKAVAFIACEVLVVLFIYLAYLRFVRKVDRHN